ncbi:MAG: N-acylglucosamine 2-epimerase [Bacteroidetes bacterium]|jgi:mannobiose 2-epimerase|nr:N-acylglucosamine 2-epimerase [Bacteroidota bacterium]
MSFLILYGCNPSGQLTESTEESVADEIQTELNKLTDVWYPRVIDNDHGGYLSRFAYDWQPENPQDKMIVTQSRHLWTLSKLGEHEPQNQSYKQYAAHGFEFLKNQMWDDQYGGFYQLVNREGEPIPNNDELIDKTLYGNAFALYGLSAYYHYTQNPAALLLAKQTFNWLESHSHDPVHGGYFQPLGRDGTPDKTGTPKDYNSGIHILEALTELYTVWKDDLVKERLEEMFYIVRDTMVTDKGYLKLYFEADWTHLSYQDSSRAVIMENIGDDHVTPGHDIETAYLLLEAAHVLGMEEDQETHRIAKKLTDHTLETGWDDEAGGFYDIGYYFPGDQELTIVEDTKNWWAQAEGLNTLLIKSDLYPNDPHNYFEKFLRQWEYIQNNMIDSDHGGWYNSGLDKEPDSKTGLKAQIWKGNYHTVRSLLNCFNRLSE